MAHPSGIVFSAGASPAGSADRAAEEACARAIDDAKRRGASGWAPDLCLVFATASHAPMFPAVAARLRRDLNPANMIGLSAGAVLGGRDAFEQRMGLSLIAAWIPDAEIRPLTPDTLATPAPALETALRSAIGDPATLRASLVLGEASSTPTGELLPAISRVHAESSWGEPPPVVGALSAGGKTRGAVLLDDQIRAEGAVGLSIHAPNLRVDTLVSQGCTPFAEPMVITRARKNLILQLGGRPALEVIREAASDLDEERRRLLPGGLFIGRVIDEYKDRFGRGDFLIRSVTGVDEDLGAVAVGDLVRPGQTIQLQLRDRRTASDDLQLLLGAQSLHERPLGALLLTCAGRGRAFFGDETHDVLSVQRAFRAEPPAEIKAKAGQEVDPDEPALPLAGLFADAQIAPANGAAAVHTHAAALAMFRAVEGPETDGDNADPRP
ncbi:MAG: FIST N-terminal domain-containing protein [Phycisphaerales bacterium JB059]